MHGPPGPSRRYRVAWSRGYPPPPKGRRFAAPSRAAPKRRTCRRFMSAASLSRAARVHLTRIKDPRTSCSNKGLANRRGWSQREFHRAAYWLGARAGAGKGTSTGATVMGPMLIGVTTVSSCRSRPPPATLPLVLPKPIMRAWQAAFSSPSRTLQRAAAFDSKLAPALSSTPRFLSACALRASLQTSVAVLLGLAAHAGLDFLLVVARGVDARGSGGNLGAGSRHRQQCGRTEGPKERPGDNGCSQMDLLARACASHKHSRRPGGEHKHCFSLKPLFRQTLSPVHPRRGGACSAVSGTLATRTSSWNRGATVTPLA